ncbi:hypothetical protein ACVWW6_006060 [Bradyrhizobium sp. USDA 3311]
MRRFLSSDELHYGSRDIADRLMALLKAGELQRVDIDIVRAACASYILARTGLTALCLDDVHALEEATLRKVVGAVG